MYSTYFTKKFHATEISIAWDFFRKIGTIHWYLVELLEMGDVQTLAIIGRHVLEHSCFVLVPIITWLVLDAVFSIRLDEKASWNIL